MSTLTVRTKRGELAVALTHQDGVTQADHVEPALARSVNRWLTHGLDEWIKEGDAAQPRHTPSSAPEFLPRLGEYLTRQFPLDIRFEN